MGVFIAETLLNSERQFSPKEIKVLFVELGINYKKEVDVSEFAKLKKGFIATRAGFILNETLKGRLTTLLY